MAKKTGPTPKRPSKYQARQLPKVCLSTIYPTFGGVHPWFFSCWSSTIFDNPDGIIEGVLAKESGPNLDVNRNYLVAKFLDQMPLCDWMLFVDSDEKWVPQDLFDFCKRATPDKPIVSGLYRRVDYQTTPPSTSYAYWFLDGKPVPLDIGAGSEYVHVGAVPAGALLMHRSALSTMREKFGDNWFTADNGGGMKEDMAFCDRAAFLEIPIHVDPLFKVGHIKAYVIPG